MKIEELFKTSVEILKNEAIPTSKLDIKILLSFLLKINSSELINYFNKEMTDDFINNFQKLLNRRIKREPIANIVNKKSFWDNEFYVDKNVLTPRNDSEILIEAILENFKDFNKKYKILDLGTGSGCLILTLLKIYKNSLGLGVDISEKALKIANKNAKILNIDNVKFIKNNWNENINEKFDIIISNPPYIPTETIKTLEPEVNRYNPLISLDGGDDGLRCYKFLAKNLSKNSNKNTKLFFEIGADQEDEIIKIFETNNFKVKNIYKDFSGINRVLTIFYKLNT